MAVFVHVAFKLTTPASKSTMAWRTADGLE